MEKQVEDLKFYVLERKSEMKKSEVIQLEHVEMEVKPFKPNDQHTCVKVYQALREEFDESCDLRFSSVYVDYFAGFMAKCAPGREAGERVLRRLVALFPGWYKVEVFVQPCGNAVHFSCYQRPLLASGGTPIPQSMHLPR